MNTTIERGVDLQIGTGRYRLRLAYYGRSFFLLRVPFVGKVWSFGPGFAGRMTWAEIKQERSFDADD